MPVQAQEGLGTWKLNTGRSTFFGEPKPLGLTIRISPHAGGELFSLDRANADGRAISDSMVLYLDNKPRPIRDGNCMGTQSSQRVDSRTVEIVRRCATGEWMRLVRRLTGSELVLEITGRRADGSAVSEQLVLERR